MNWYRRNRGLRETPRGRTLLVFATAILFTLLGADMLTGGTLRGAARTVLAPLAGGAERVMAAVTLARPFSSRAALVQELDNVRQELARLRVRDAAYGALEAENRELRALTKLPENGIGIVAPILSSQRALPYSTFIIGAGSGKGVAEGSLVIAEGGFVLGVVSDVADSHSLARAVFAPGQSIDASVGSVGLKLEGRGGGNARAQVPRESPIVAGDSVRVPAFAHRPVGIVGIVETATSSAYTDVYVAFPINANEVRFVTVIPPALPQEMLESAREADVASPEEQP